MSAVIEISKSLDYQQIKEVYTSGYVKDGVFKTGVEYERIPLSVDTNCSADYYGEHGICNLLREFAARENWDYILDSGEIIGLKQGHDTITLEPGCQMEYSLEPVKTLAELENNIKKLDQLIKPISDEFGIRLIKYGVSPVYTYKNINLIPKKRYHVMAKYMWGILSDVMMRETAGIQGTFDFESEEDAINKFKIANMLTPFMTAMFANSPIRGGVDTGYKSFRALSWLNTDNDRCGFAYNFDKDYSFDDYISYILDAPMMFINRNGEPLKINGKFNFKEYMLSGFCDNNANLEDYLLQANLCFPEVRLRNFIEVRNHDCGAVKAVMSVMAIYKGILYNSDARSEIENLFSSSTFEDFSELRYSVPKTGLQSEFKNKKVLDYAGEIIKIAETSLKEFNPGEEQYLDYIKKYVADGISPADVILKNWYGSWNKDISKLIEFIS